MLAKVFKNIPFYFLFFLTISSVFAQSPYYRKITSRDGLPSMTIYDIIEDSQGYLWLATEAGICRYDGVRFQTFPVPASKGKSFTGLKEDSQGKIYFVNFSGQFFCLHQSKVREIKLPEGLRGNNFFDYEIDQNNNVWLVAKGQKVYVRFAGTQQWKMVCHIKDSNGMVGVIRIYKDTKGFMWVTWGSRLYRIDKKFKMVEITKIPFPFIQISYFRDKIFFTGFDAEGTHFYDVKQNLLKEALRDIPADMKHSQSIRIYPDREQNLWVVSNAGVMVYDTQLKLLSKSVFLQNQFVSKVVQDREGNYWFTTIGKGLFMMPERQTIHFNSTNSVLSFDQVNCFAVDSNGHFFIGTNGNQLFFFDTDQQTVTPRFELSTGDIECMYLDETSKKLYVETFGLEMYDLNNDQLIKQFGVGSSEKDIDLFQNKYLVVAAGNGAYLTARENDFEKYPLPRALLEKYGGKTKIFLREGRSRTVLAESSEKRFWVGYADGLYYYENAENYELKTKEGASIIAIDMIEDVEGVIWVGTRKQGVFAIKNKKIIQQLTTKNGLISNHCRVLKQGNELFLGTDKGLQVYHLKNKTSKVFNQEDGLPSNEIKVMYLHRDKIYLGTPAGLTVLNKSFISINTQPPLIYITGLAIKDVHQPLKSNYTLAYHQNNLSITFNGIALRSAGQFRYKYRLLGLDTNWTYNNSASNFARYSSLPSGAYTFEVKVINEDGVESQGAAKIAITIAYPLWQKWWFISFIALTTIGLVMFIFNNRIRAIRRKNQLEKDLGKATLDALKLQMNPHFIFNAMGAVQHYMIKNDGKRASNYLARFGQLMRAILENSRSEYISLEEEIEMLEAYLELQTLRQEGSFTYHINVDEQLDSEEIAIPPMFAQPFIENAIEHGVSPMKGGGIIDISFSLENDMVLLKIEDNGIGYQQSLKGKAHNPKEHNSMASKITEERIALYQKSLRKNIRFEIESHNEGTTVKFWLPFQIQ